MRNHFAQIRRPAQNHQNCGEVSDVLAHLDRLFADGPIPFERFMESALYDPEFGYYTANIATVGGRSADFATTATLSKKLGKAIAGWIQQQFDECNFRTVVEVGGGDGSLAKQVLKSMGFFLRRSINYRIVEISPVLQATQKKLLGNKASWFSTIDEAISDIDDAIIFSNELVDSFPARWLRWNEGWEEIYVNFDRKNGLSEQFRPVSDIQVPELLERTNQRIEVHDSYRQWIRDWMPRLTVASVLTIDYGGTAKEIYERRLAGTMRGYFKHERIEGGGIYSRFGKQDLTADVNFEDLKKWGIKYEFNPTRYETQGEFLHRMGIKNDPLSEANEAFQVLEQVKRSDSI